MKSGKGFAITAKVIKRKREIKSKKNNTNDVIRFIFVYALMFNI